MQREFSHAFAKIYRHMTMDSRLPTACAGVSAMQLSIILDVIGTPTPEEVVLLHSLACSDVLVGRRGRVCTRSIICQIFL